MQETHIMQSSETRFSLE